MPLTRDWFAEKRLIGVVHLLPLPGSPRPEPLHAVAGKALRDAKTLEEAGFDAVIVENFGDRPFPVYAEPITVAAMTRIAGLLVEELSIPVGVNILRNDGVAALSVAETVGAAFIRVNAYTELVASGEGFLEPLARKVQLLKARLGSSVAVFADILVKHGVSLSARPGDYYHAALDAVERGLADAVIVTGPVTGEPPSPEALREAARSGAPVLLGSGLRPDNAARFRGLVEGAIVGTYLHRNSGWREPVDPERARKIVEAWRGQGA